MISRLLIWTCFMFIPWAVFYFYGVGQAVITGISINTLLQIFANEETRDIRERQIKFINEVCKKFNITIKE